MITALMIKPGEHPRPTKLWDDPDFLRCAISIGSIAMGTTAAVRLDNGIAVLFNLDGAINGLPGNRCIGSRIISGTFYIVGHSDYDLISLTDSQISHYIDRFWFPEQHDDDSALLSWMRDMEISIDQQYDAILNF